MKIVMIVQARMGSSRLPGKVLMPASGKPMLAHQIERLRNVRFANHLVVATTTNPKDDAIVEFCNDWGVSVFRGDEDDVLARFAAAATTYEADVVVRLTADCPLIDPAVIDQAIACYLEAPSPHLYVSNTIMRTYPRGMDTEVFSCHLLAETDRVATLRHDREHVTPYMIRNDRSDIVHRNVVSPKNLSAYRFTLDHPKDYTQISGLIESRLSDFSVVTLMSHAEALGLNWFDNAEQTDIAVRRPDTGLIPNNELLSRFGLGAAQFGMYYGRFNSAGVPSPESTHEILDTAGRLGLSCIDTARLYGQSEAIIGQCKSALRRFSIITKTPQLPEGKIQKKDAQILRAAFETSLRLMNQTSIEGLLIHHAPNLLFQGGEHLYQAMVDLKNEGLVRRIGVSAYSGNIVEQIHERFPLDMAQLPMNLLDRRLIESGSLLRLTNSGIKIHVRSAFLQGLLLAKPASLSDHFQPARSAIEAFQQASKDAGVNPAQAALHYLLAIPEIEKIIVGVESLNQLKAIFLNFPTEVKMDFSKYRVDQLDILNPVQWAD